MFCPIRIVFAMTNFGRLPVCHAVFVQLMVVTWGVRIAWQTCNANRPIAGLSVWTKRNWWHMLHCTKCGAKKLQWLHYVQQFTSACDSTFTNAQLMLAKQPNITRVWPLQKVTHVGPTLDAPHAAGLATHTWETVLMKMDFSISLELR